jgi:chromosome segregation ATPase
MDKYQFLNRGIENARRETSQLAESKEDMLRKAEQLRHDRETMMQRMTRAQTEATQLRLEIQQTQSLSLLPLRAPAATSTTSIVTPDTNTAAHQYQQQRVAFLQEHAEQQRRDFCEESRTFRATVKRLKLTSTECGLDMAMSHAFLQIHGVDVTEENVVENQPKESHLLSSELESNEVLQDAWHDEAMAATAAPLDDSAINTDNSDFPHHSASLAYQLAFVARQVAEHAYNDCRIALGEAKDRAKLRAQKRSILKSQLVRLRTTIQELEKELNDTQEQTRELEALTEMYRQRVQRVPPRDTYQQQPLTQQPRRGLLPSNPYTRSNGCTTEAAGSHDDRAVQQHPHLVGRIRMDRQFGGASIGVDIGGAHAVATTSCTVEDSDSDDDINDFVPFRRNT